MDENAPSLVLGNRISWNRYEQIRRSEGLTKSNPRKCASVSDNDTPTPKRKNMDVEILVPTSVSYMKKQRVGQKRKK